MENYRRIWEKHNGYIPTDSQGRKFEIHHVDGNRKNNDLSNLQCISIEEHYQIHLKQEDWAAAFRIAQRMKIDPEIKSDLMSKSNKKRLEKGDHPFLDDKLRAKIKQATMKKLANKEHPFQNPETQQKAAKAKQERYTHEDLSAHTKKGWDNWKKNNPGVDRTTKGSEVGAAKTRDTKWYHKLDGSQLRTTPTDPRIAEEGWLMGRFGGKELSAKANLGKLNKKQ